jgi:hypothetical protein
LDLHFSDFSTVFNDFSKVQLKTLKHTYKGTLILFSRNYAEVPGLRKSPWIKTNPRNVVPAGGQELTGGGS